MSTYVLVHGGGHGGWCYQRVARILRGAGHEVYTPTLTGVGERSHLLFPEIDLDLHIRDVVQILEYEDLSDVILAGHSYGGMVITGVADRATARIGHLVYLDAAKPTNGQALAEIAQEPMSKALAEMREVDGVQLTTFPNRERIERNFGLNDPADVAWVSDKLTPHPWKCYAQPLKLENEDALNALPFTIIDCVAASGPPREQPGRFKAAERIWQIETGHDLMITEPAAVSEMLMRLAAL